MYTIEQFNSLEEAKTYYKDNAEDYCRTDRDWSCVYFEVNSKYYEMNITPDNITWVVTYDFSEPEEFAKIVIKSKVNFNIQQDIKKLNKQIVELTKHFI